MAEFQVGVEGRDPKIFRSFNINGLVKTDTTYRTSIIEYFTQVSGKKFLDIGGADGYEARALSIRGAASSISLEGKESLHWQAKSAARVFGQSNHMAILGDARQLDSLDLGVFDVALCFGFLYHLVNPYNFLKRVARVTDGLLLLETHVAPEVSFESLLVPKHRGALLGAPKILYLDGERFEGRICIHRGDHMLSKGSLEEPWTFWLTQASLIKALIRSGFEIINWYHEMDDKTPNDIRSAGDKLGFGHANTKIFLVARVSNKKIGEIPSGTVSESPDKVVLPEIRESFFDSVRYHGGKMMRLLNRF